MSILVANCQALPQLRDDPITIASSQGRSGLHSNSKNVRTTDLVVVFWVKLSLDAMTYRTAKQVYVSFALLSRVRDFFVYVLNHGCDVIKGS